MVARGQKCISEEQIKEQEYQSQSPACITRMYEDNEGRIHEEGQISLSCAEIKEATISAFAHGI